MIQNLSQDLFRSFTAAEISYELEMMLSVYIQHAPVDRLTLANAAGLTTRLINYLNKVETELERTELIENDTYK